MDVTIYDNGEGQFVSGGVRVLTGGAESPLALLETTVPPGFPGPKLHRHAEMFDIFYILDGSLLFQVGDDQRLLKRGGFAMIPPGVVHTFSNPGAEPARFINIYRPAGLEQYVIEIAKRFAAGTVPTQEEMAELAKGQDFEAVERGWWTAPGCGSTSLLRNNGIEESHQQTGTPHLQTKRTSPMDHATGMSLTYRLGTAV